MSGLWKQTARWLLLIAVVATLAGCGGSARKFGTSISDITGNGNLEVTTTPPNAKIYVNNRYEGRTPYRANLNEGMYRIQVEKNGYRKAEEWARVRRGQKEFLNIELEAE